MKTSEIFMDENGAQREHLYSAHQSLINWKPIFAGVFVAFITYVTLSALGAGVFGASIANTLENGNSASTLTGAAAIWMVISCLLSLFAGTYFATRTSTSITARIGAAQGGVIASLFFAFMLYGVGKSIGAAGSGLSSLVGVAGESSASLLATPAVQNTIDRALGGSTLKSEPTVVAQELAVRLLRGNTESARNYLAYQTGLPASEVQARFAVMENEYRAAMQSAGVATADAVAKAGWSLFAILVLGMGSAIFGGSLGSRANFRKPLADDLNMAMNPVVVQTV